MGRVGVVMGLVAAGLFGCASTKSAQVMKGTGGSGLASEAPALERYVNEELGFEISRPKGSWHLDTTDELSPDGLAIPVVIKHTASGAQVVVQVAPAVATPTQFAERLSAGLREYPGVITQDIEPVAIADGAVAFRFAMGDRVLGKVTVLEGSSGRMLMTLATWPTNASDQITQDVEAIVGSVKVVEPRPAVGNAQAAR